MFINDNIILKLICNSLKICYSGISFFTSFTSISSNVSGIFLLVISGRIGNRTADKIDKAAAKIIIGWYRCNTSNSPNEIPIIAPTLAAKEQIPFRLVLRIISNFNQVQQVLT